MAVIRDAIAAKLSEPDEELRVSKETENRVYIKNGDDDVFRIDVSEEGYKAYQIVKFGHGDVDKHQFFLKVEKTRALRKKLPKSKHMTFKKKKPARKCTPVRVREPPTVAKYTVSLDAWMTLDQVATAIADYMMYRIM